jgi:RHS repeat-associated protein
VSQVVKDGVTTNYAWVDSGSTRTLTITDPLGHHKVVTSDLTIGRPASMKDELNRTTSYQYDTNGRLTRLTKPEGNSTQLTYDARGNVTQTQQVAKTGSGLADIVASASFDSTCANLVTCNQPNSTTDAKGNVTNYAYDATHGGVTSVTRPAPASGGVRPQTRASYAQVTSASGDLVYELTGVSQCQTLASCAGSADETKVTAGYDAYGNVTSLARSNGTGTLTSASGMTYDAEGDLLTVDGPLSGTADTSRTRYDAARRTVGITSPDPDGAGAMKMRAVRLTYRGDGQVSKQELGTVNSQSDADWALFAPLETVDVTFDANARPMQQKLSASGTAYALTQTSYDSLGRSDCTAVRMNTAVYGSLPASACTLSTAGSFGPDRIGQTIYDAAGEVTQNKVGVGTVDAATERTLTYSNNGLVSSLTDGENNKTTYVYDGFDRLSQTQYPSATKGAGTSNAADYEQLGYDANSNVISRRLRDATSIAFSYDNLDRVTLKNLPGTEPDVSYGYDNLDRITSASQTGNALSFGYDALSRKTSESGPLGTVTFGYDAADERTSIAYPSTTALTINYAYLTTGELDTIKQSTTVLADYAYDNLGNRTGVTFGNGASQAFTYDPVSRLSQLTNALTDTNDLTATFSYSPASQIASTTRTGDTYAWTGHGNGSTAYVSNGRNQQTSIGGVTASWDSKGNLTTEPQSGKTYGYSSENLLTSASGGVTLGYDPAMRLYQTVGAATTRFMYDGLDAIAEYNASNALQRRFVFDPTTDQPVLWYEGTGTAATNRRYLSQDERGSVISVSSSTGASLGVNTYDEYGKPGASNVGRFQYTGQMYLPETGTYHFPFRDLVAQEGIFAQTDPFGQAGGPNIYVYVGGDPVNFIDPLGLEPKCPNTSKTNSDPSGGGDSDGGDIVICGSKLPPSIPGGSLGGGGQPIVLGGGGGQANPTPEPEIRIIGQRERTQIVTGPLTQLFPPNLDPLLPHFLFDFPFLQDGCAEACLEAGTLVATPTGLKPIETIAVGDLVLSEDEQTGAVAAKKVTRLIRPGPKPVYALALRDVSGAMEAFHATADHRWMVDGKGWVETADLRTGERIRTDSKADVTVTSVSRTNIVERTYNLEVADWHTFMIGKDHVVVHNGCPPSLSPVWQHLRPVKGRNIRTDGSRYYSYDRLHGTIEVFDSRGNHLGEIDAVTGVQTKGPNPSYHLTL